MEIAILGYGNIGSGVVEIIERNQDQIVRKVGEPVHVKYVLDLREFEGDPIQDRVVHDLDIILNDPEVVLGVETMGGDEPAFTFTRKMLEAGKNMVTSNKVVVANHGPELLKIAAENSRNYMFEASVGGGIPIIRTMNNALAQEHILSIIGILNGTTNFMLTRMDKDGVSFDDILKKAQDLGYAERNPEADVEGHDACRKIAILSSLMCGKNVDFEKIYTEGITKVSTEDFLYAKKLGRSIKLLAKCKQTEAGLEAMVAPCMISTEHPLYSVNDVFNAVFVTGDMLDDSMYFGRGAGKLPTASAVVADIIEACRFAETNLPMQWSDEEAPLVDVSESRHAFLVRVSADTSEAELEAAFGKGQTVRCAELQDEYAFVTAVLSEKEFEEKSAQIKGIVSRIRLED